MAGLRPDPVPARRLVNVAQAGGARGVGGYLPASPRTTTATEHTPGRVLRPNPPAATGGGLYIPTFSIPGELTARYYESPLQNITGRTLTVTRMYVRVGQQPTGGPIQVEVYKDEGTFASATIIDLDYEGNSLVDLSWEPESFLTVDITAVGPVYGGADLVIQLLTA